MAVCSILASFSILFQLNDLTSCSYNESLRLAGRRLLFNVDELKRAAAESVNKPVSEIKNFRKLAEGGFNRIFEISMEDGSSVLARLPYPSTSPRRLAVANEVATLAFVRAHGIPAPRVLDYSIDDNAVGAKYIIMEKMPGKPIADAWFNLSGEPLTRFIYELVQLELKLFNIDLPASGSLYYARDLPPRFRRIRIPGSEDGLCIGPYTTLEWWYGERGDLDIDRGPRKWYNYYSCISSLLTHIDIDSRLVLQSPAEKELAWIRAYGKPRFPFERIYRETFDYKKQNPEEYASSLMEYLRLAPYLVPASPELNRPVLRHPDLQPNNIFVSDDLTTITGLIDWQHSQILPGFLAAGIPKRFANYADNVSMSLVKPKLPENFESLDEGKRATAQERFRLQQLHYLYVGCTMACNKPHWHALSQDAAVLKTRIYALASSPWEGVTTRLQNDIICVAKNWSLIASAADPGNDIPACPVQLPGDEEMKKITTTYDSLYETNEEMELINNFVGVSSDGWTTNEDFAEAKEKAAWIKKIGLEEVKDDPWLLETSLRHWPFDDFDEEE